MRVLAANLKDGDVIREQGSAAKVVGDARVERGIVAVDLVTQGNTYHYGLTETVTRDAS